MTAGLLLQSVRTVAVELKGEPTRLNAYENDVHSAECLDDLLEALTVIFQDQKESDQELYGRHAMHLRPMGLAPDIAPNLDLCALPYFGGDDPGMQVPMVADYWSWDERRVLVGTGLDDLEIITREQFKQECGG